MKKIKIIMLIGIINLFATDVDSYLDISKCDKVVNKGYYKACYSYRLKSILGGWTVLDKNAAKKGIKKRPRFYPDRSLSKKNRIKYSDYTGFGKLYNRGHTILADADADENQDKLSSTYSMLNITAQSALVNQKTWSKVERYGRLTAKKLGSLHSITLVQYDNPENKINGKVTIPSRYFRIYYNDKYNFKKCFLYLNNLNPDWKNDKLKNHEINCESIELLKNTLI